MSSAWAVQFSSRYENAGFCACPPPADVKAPSLCSWAPARRDVPMIGRPPRRFRSGSPSALNVLSAALLFASPNACMSGEMKANEVGLMDFSPAYFSRTTRSRVLLTAGRNERAGRGGASTALSRQRRQRATFPPAGAGTREQQAVHAGRGMLHAGGRGGGAAPKAAMACTDVFELSMRRTRSDASAASFP